MKPANRIFAAVWLLMAVSTANAVETASYETILTDGDFELREYAAQVRVETVVEAGFKQAGSKAFSLLFDYISGANRSRGDAANDAEKISMTAPVTQAAAAKISMTSPVSQNRYDGDSWQIGFLLPASYTPDTAPLPTDPNVFLRSIAPQKMATVRYTGTWSNDNYSEKLTALEAWIEQQGLKIAGEPTWARYDPPFKPWFLRRNEILIPVQ